MQLTDFQKQQIINIFYIPSTKGWKDIATSLVNGDTVEVYIQYIWIGKLARFIDIQESENDSYLYTLDLPGLINSHFFKSKLHTDIIDLKSTIQSKEKEISELNKQLNELKDLNNH